MVNESLKVSSSKRTENSLPEPDEEPEEKLLDEDDRPSLDFFNFRRCASLAVETS
jgi:hypothetical protein